MQRNIFYGRVLLPVLVLTGTGATSMFASWCAIGYFVLRSPRSPHGNHEYDPLLLLLPVLVFAVDYLISLRLVMLHRFTTCIVATLCGVALGVALILQFGVPFLWWIGLRR